MMRVRSLTEGSLSRGILLFSLPLMASNLLQVLFNMADVAVVGQFAGSRALGSVGSTVTLVTLFTGFLMGIGSGVNVLTARYIGAKDNRGVRDTVHTALLLCFTAGMLILTGGVLGTRALLELLGTKEELIEGAVLYLRIYFLGMPALAVYNFGNGVYSAAGNTKKPLAYLTIAGVLNVVLNLVLVIVFHLDVAGVAIASVISQYVSAALILISLLRCREEYGLRGYRPVLVRDKAAALLTLGVPAGLQNAIFQIANLFIQAGVNSFDAVVVEGASAAANADGLVYDVMAAFYTACSSFMGQNYGAGKRDRVRRSYFISLAYSFGIGALMGGFLVLFGESFLGIFTSDAAVIEAGMERLTVMGLSYGVSAFMDCTIAASRGLGRSLAPTVIVILGSCVFRVIWVYTVFAFFHTILSLYLLYIFSWSLTALFEILYFIRAYRQTCRSLL
ncbi:MAG: MATE family efflux transporter [Clostridia bacterium]|nr:MATE family efflux transporter [Clostridia bacterium]